MTPFLTLYTPTYRRPRGLAACLASVAKQSLVSDIEQIVVPDHVGRGIAGMYAQIPHYVDAVHGAYVHVLADDDVLMNGSVVAQVQDFAQAEHAPAVILVDVLKAGSYIRGVWPPVLGAIDLGNLIVRADVWKAHAADYGLRYEGDYDFAQALYEAGHRAVHLPLVFLSGGVSRGEAEAA